MNKTKNKAFTSMLVNASRNHYTMNQMFDRKARILLTINVLILSVIIGNIVDGKALFDYSFFLCTIGGLFCLVSIICAVLAINPENDGAHLTTETINDNSLNPLYFGNYLNMTSNLYEDAMMEMSEDADFAHRSILKDMYQIGTVLDRKRKYLRYCLFTLAIGACSLLLLAFGLRIIVGV